MDSNDIGEKIFIIGILVVAPLIAMVMSIMKPSGSSSVDTYKIYYTYVDLDNNEGIADKCKRDGTPICELEDGTVIAVKQYKRVRESKGDNNE